ncbi:HAD hydrolase family protein [Maribellus comscasis]|uniref:HAD hydrolase family protein n=1 Tax=Maribellus comscasis TaxID=2681766 RepID=A0A6I6JXS8_9BACT|nr:HAD hydrolase family protein [Maribellus comscasis]QGY45950.1 HAD hydrolase family protein [Maribellus comscasis]
MSFFKEELKNVKAFVFDVDGVLSKDVLSIGRTGILMRTANVKDGFAIRNAVKSGFPIAIITGGYSNRVRLRYKQLGVKFYYQSVRDKVKCLEDFMEKNKVESENILYMGDDLVDFNVMKAVGIPTCPKDAVADIKEISKYISDKTGGEGCVRDVIEQVMRAQNKWFTNEMLKSRAF